MKVLCIDTKFPKSPHLLKPEHYIYEGEIYTVHSGYIDQHDHLEYYYLEERLHFDPRPSYRATRFIPLSDIDETVLLNERTVEAVA